MATSPDIDGTELEWAVIPDSRQDTGSVEAERAVLPGEKRDADEYRLVHGRNLWTSRGRIEAKPGAAIFVSFKQSSQRRNQ
jgi:hypothetical protein